MDIGKRCERSFNLASVSDSILICLQITLTLKGVQDKNLIFIQSIILNENESNLKLYGEM